MNKISVKNIDGTVEEFDLVNAFKINEIDKKFALLSKGEFAGTEMLSKVYVTEFEETNPGIYNLIGIKDEQVWKAVTSAMKLIVQSASDKYKEETKDVANKLSNEVNNLIKGSIVKSDEYNTKKAIGIDKENLTENENGIIPLANQKCFKTEEVIETFNAFDAIPKQNEESVIETLDLPKLDSPLIDNHEIHEPVLDSPVQNTNKFTSELANPMMSNGVLDESPVSLGDFSSLSTLASKEEEAIPVVQNTTEEKKFVEMELPQMPEMVAKEPENVNNSLFEETVIPTIQQPVIDEIKPLEPIENKIDTVVEKIQESKQKNSAPEIIDIDKIIEEKKDKLVHTVLDKLNEITLDINTIFDEMKEILGESYVQGKTNEPSKPQSQQNVNDTIVGDALAYINNMQIPTEEASYGRVA